MREVSRPASSLPALLMTMRPVSIARLRHLCLVVSLAGSTGLAGCAPAGVNSNRSLGGAERAPAEVVVVEAQPEPDPGQVREDELRRQRREIAQLREQIAADRSRTEAATARAEAAVQESQATIRALQSELAEVRARADTASAQSNQALATATEFLSNLVAAREEQRVIVERNLQTSNALDRRLREVEGRVTEADRRRQADLAQTGSRSSELDTRLQRTDQDLAQLRAQLAELYRENEQTRAAIDSGPMLRMLRDLEATQHETTILRGLVEEVQRDQQESRKRLQDYYLDLDARIQTLQDRQRELREPDVQGFSGDNGLTPGADSVRDLDSERLQSFDGQPQGAETAAATQVENVPGVVGTIDSVPAAIFDGAGAGQAGTGAAKDAEPQPVTAHGLMTTDWAVNVQGQAPGSPGQ